MFVAMDAGISSKKHAPFKPQWSASLCLDITRPLAQCSQEIKSNLVSENRVKLQPKRTLQTLADSGCLRGRDDKIRRASVVCDGTWDIQKGIFSLGLSEHGCTKRAITTPNYNYSGSLVEKVPASCYETQFYSHKGSIGSVSNNGHSLGSRLVNYIHDYEKNTPAK